MTFQFLHFFLQNENQSHDIINFSRVYFLKTEIIMIAINFLEKNDSISLNLETINRQTKL